METISPEGRCSPEVARKSLIAISQSAPDKVPSPGVLAKASTDVNGVELNGGSFEEFRAKLISIAYSESPDVKTPPPPLVNPSA